MRFLKAITKQLVIVIHLVLPGMAQSTVPILNPVNGHYYQLIEVKDGTNWFTAKTNSEAMQYNRRQGYLSTITSSQEQNFIINNFPDLAVNSAWIGAIDRSSQHPNLNRACFKWINREAREGYCLGTFQLTYWGKGEPNGYPTRTCMAIKQGSVDWYDENCINLLNHYLVEYSQPILMSCPLNFSRDIPSSPNPVYYINGDLITEENCALDAEYTKFDLYTYTTIPIDDNGEPFCIGEKRDYLLWHLSLAPGDGFLHEKIDPLSSPDFNRIAASFVNPNCLLTDQEWMSSGHGTGCYIPKELPGSDIGYIDLDMENRLENACYYDSATNSWKTRNQLFTRVNLYERYPVTVDVLPGSLTDSINTTTTGKIPIAILTTNSFDASEADPATCLVFNASPLSWSLQDIDNDGDQDLVFAFLKQEIDFTQSSSELTLVGKTFDGLYIGGSDSVSLFPQPKQIPGDLPDLKQTPYEY